MGKGKAKTEPRPAPEAGSVVVTLDVPRYRDIALYKGEAGFFRCDCGTYTSEGWLKIVEYGIDRFHRDGLLGADTLKSQGKDPRTEANAHAERREAMLRGEEPIGERSARVSPIVEATRRVLLKVLTQQGVKLADVGKLGSTVESAWEAAAKVLPAILKNRETLDAQARVIAEALDLSGIKLDLSA